MPWASRWGALARAAGIESEERLLVALSGGADSVLLLHLLAAAEPRPAFRAVHVEHGLRGEEGREDAHFCANLCRALGVPLDRLSIDLDPEGPSLEARARAERYRALCAVARESRHTTLITGHHADDALETLLMRFVRGTPIGGLSGLRPRLSLRRRDPFALEPSPTGSAADEELEPVHVVRPLLALRREEVRRLLSDRGITWREDSSNEDRRFTRNRVRRDLLPTLEALCGEEGIDNLRAFGAAVDRFEAELAAGTAHLAWAPPAYAKASRTAADSGAGGSLPRGPLTQLPTPLKRRALWRLILEGTGKAPGRRLLEMVVADLARGRCSRHSLPNGWTLWLRAAEVQLLPPPATEPEPAPHPQAELPFPEPGGDAGRGTRTPSAGPWVRSLESPGVVTLPDGRSVTAEPSPNAPGTPPPRGPLTVELDAAHLPDRLEVRWPRPGDRFHPLGGPGSRPLVRFLADAGVPREERGRVPLVVSGDTILWVCGLRPCEGHRVREGTRQRVRLGLHREASGRAAG